MNGSENEPDLSLIACSSLATHQTRVFPVSHLAAASSIAVASTAAKPLGTPWKARTVLPATLLASCYVLARCTRLQDP